MTTYIYVYFALIAVASASPYKDCGSTKGQVTAVHISGCPDGSKECELKKGTTAEIVVDFIPNENSANLTLNVSAVIFGENIPLLSENACNGMGIQCPVQANQQYTGQTSVPIQSSFPDISLSVKGRLIDGNGNNIACVVIPAKIVN